MKKYVIYTMSLLMLALVSCNKPSLQKYIVDSQNNSKFVTLDFSSSILPIKMKEDASEEDKKAYESIRKVNIAFLPTNKATEEELTAERQKIKEILKSSGYKTLMKFNDKKGKATLYYTGETDAIDEIVGFVDVKEMGVGVGRLLGDDMNPNAIMKMMRSVNVDGDDGQLQNLKKMIESNVDSIKSE
ncbi:DUF4252 domain-containing protein [uncultured Tenacibaculum sp.]|uniref:DUF4252 domain-containing protein n=1 Tax=uncultured Tenacibaculum sp. TaxID=174713 RepID=UPI002639F125|nr:DUF4252 domain-containing protein [uncultured Tenacibaculum sp.]